MYRRLFVVCVAAVCDYKLDTSLRVESDQEQSRYHVVPGSNLLHPGWYSKPVHMGGATSFTSTIRGYQHNWFHLSYHYAGHITWLWYPPHSSLFQVWSWALNVSYLKSEAWSWWILLLLGVLKCSVGVAFKSCLRSLSQQHFPAPSFPLITSYY